MPIALVKKRREFILETLTATLNKAMTAFGRFSFNESSRNSIGGVVLSAVNKQKGAYSWCTERTITDFLADEINLALRATKRPAGARVPLTAWEGFADGKAAAERLLSSLQTLPWQYELLGWTPLTCEGDEVITLSDDFHLVSFSDKSAAKYEVGPIDVVDADVFSRSYPERVESGRFYLCGQFEGYIREFEPTEQASVYCDALLGVLGLLCCDVTLAINPFYYGGPPPAIPVMMYRVSGTRELIGYRWLTAEQTAAVQRLALTADGKARPSARAAAIAPAFGHVPTRSAARWLHESYFGSNGLMQVVQATIALEIIFGERKESRQTGLSSLLANRLAYLIGNSPREREQIIDHFKELYDFRSAIVHAGAATLGDAEQAALAALQGYAQRAIQVQIAELRRPPVGNRPTPRPK